MASAAGMLSHTASAIDAKIMPVSHDLTINSYTTTKHCCTCGSYLKSAKFVAGGRRWYLRYYPNGCGPEKRHRLTFLLYHDRDAGADEDKVSVSYKISLLGLDGNPIPGYEDKYGVTYDDPPVYRNGLIDRTVLEQSSYLRDDSFSVRCEFRVPIIVTETLLPPSDEPPLSSSPNRTHVPAEVVNEGLVRFISDELPTDVALEVGDETFPAHRRFLAAQSPVFAAMFSGPMRENTAPSVRIDDMEPRVFKAMLDFMYRGKLPPAVDDEGNDRIAMTQHLLVAAERYNLERLKSICAEKLRRHINTSTVATTLELALRYGCRALKDACCDFLASHRRNLQAILKSEGFEQLIIDYPSVIVELLARVAPSPL